MVLANEYYNEEEYIRDYQEFLKNISPWLDKSLKNYT
jgi:hypothetical protein